ncbi:MAG: glycosyltransferase [Candidatus Omnitrophota bacterium]|nr:glycosyltransferase [Candidatus Omnitrophota bacterium]
MKILIVMNYRPNWGGLTGAVEELVKSLKGEGFCVDIASTRGRIRDRIKSIANILRIAPHYNFIMATGCGYHGFFPIFIGVIVAKIYRKKVLVDFHEGYPAPFMSRLGRIIKLFLGNIPVTVASKYLFDIFNGIGKYTLKGTSKTFLTTETSQGKVPSSPTKLANEVSCKYKFNVSLIPYHFHYEDFPKREKPFSWNKKIMWVGTFQFMYNPETALKACEIVLKKRDDIEFHFFGDGPLLGKLKKKYAHPKIIFNGFIPRSDLLKEYQQYCAFLNSSFGDNFPLRLVEAGFNKLLIISVNYGGTSSIYSDKECLFFEKGNYQELAQHILKVLDNPTVYDSFRINMYNKIMTFTWDNAREKWLSFLKA